MTVGVPAADLRRAVEWYRTTFELDTPDLEPSEGIVEFKLGPVWVQLVEATGGPQDGGTILRIGVHDAAAERERLKSMGVTVGELENVDNVIEYFDFVDPDGNHLGVYAEVEP